MALAMFGLTMAGYGHQQICSQMGCNYQLSFTSLQQKTLGMERKLTTLYLEVVSRSIRLTTCVEEIKEMKNCLFQVSSQY